MRYAIICSFCVSAILIVQCATDQIADSGPCVITGSTLCLNQTLERNAGAQQVAQILQEVLDIVSAYPTDLREFSRLHNKLERIRKLQPKHAALTRTMEDRMAKLPPIREWCQNMFNGVRIKAYPGMGFGLEADRNITDKESIINVDFKDAIKSQEADVLFKEFKKIPAPKNQKFTFWNKHFLMSLYLSSLRVNSKSRWTDYLDILPINFTMPHYFDPEAMGHFYTSAGINYSLWSIHDMVHMYAKAYLHIHENPCCCSDTFLTTKTFTFDLFRWAFLTSLTRVFLDDHGVMMFPCWDLSNHDANSLIHSFPKYSHVANPQLSFMPDGRMEAHAARNITEGEQLTHSYNRMYSTVDHFFNTWGIVEPSGAQFVLIELSKTNSLYRLRRAALSMLNINILGAWIRVVQYTDLPIEPKDFKFIAAMATARKPQMELSQRAWMKTWRFLGRCVQKQKSKHRSESELKKLLENTSLSVNSRTAVSVLLAEHEALRRVRDYSVDLANQDTFEIELKQI